MLTGTEVLRENEPEPWWRVAVPALDRETSLPPGYADGWTFVSPVIDMPVHLRWLVARIEELGGTLTRMNLSALPDDGTLVVNATGLGARHFGADSSVRPVRGQVAVVEQVGLDRWTLDTGGLTYVVPRSAEIVIGGTDVEGEWSRTPDPATAAEVLHRATALVPELEGARVLRHKVGLRPGRPEVRVERVGDVIHCYGHGGAGVTLAWGCARDVVGLADG
jgi:D-amino-acid oxidase